MSRTKAAGALGALVLAVGGSLLAAPGTAQAARSDDPQALSLAVFGDSPYGKGPGDTAEFADTPAFIDAVNADPDVSEVVHVGDIHSGKQYCTAAYDRSVAQLWTRFADPLVYTPGDNEWADCHKPAEGGGSFDPATGTITYNAAATDEYAHGDPLANLDLVRSTFFPEAGRTLGGGGLVVQ
ncbi:MAG: metallophosphoesterase, partial [Mycobacteriales bacterium]